MALIVDNLVGSYQSEDGSLKPAIGSLSFTHQAGSFLTIVGPSGCGKSTLLNLIGGFIKAECGSIHFNNKQVIAPYSGCGIVFQQGDLFDWLTLRQNIEFGLRMGGKSRAEYRKCSDEWLAKIGLQHAADQLPPTLSGGMAQRTALARALANDPEILLLDEPLGALDALTRESMQQLLLSLWLDSRKTMVMVTHNIEEAILLGQRVLILSPSPGIIIGDLEIPFSDAERANPTILYANPDFIALRQKIYGLLHSNS